MAAPNKFTQQQVIDALKAERGNISRASDVLGCDTNTTRRYIDKFPKVKQAYRAARARRVDRAEQKLDEAIDNGEPWAIALILKTLGKHRGYYEYQRVRSEVSGPNGGPIQTQQVFNHDAAAASIAARSGAHHRSPGNGESDSDGPEVG